MTRKGRIGFLHRATPAADQQTFKRWFEGNLTAVSILAAVALVAVVTLTVLAGGAAAQSGQPIRIGFSMAMTGGLATNGKSALLAQKIWEEDVNKAGGLLGRPVKLVYYDDKSAPAELPAIHTKLLDIDKGDL